jgi:hypothetical protein
MIYTEAQLIVDGACAESIVFARARGFDFSRCYQQLDRPDWMVWLLQKVNALTAENNAKIVKILMESTNRDPIVMCNEIRSIVPNPFI